MFALSDLATEHRESFQKWRSDDDKQTSYHCMELSAHTLNFTLDVITK